MRAPHRVALAGGLGFAVSCLVACGGGSGLLSGGQANSLNAALDQVSNAVAAGHCAAATSALNSLRAQVAQLPASVNTALTDNLNQGISTVAVLAARQCTAAPVQTTTNTTTKSTTTSSTTTTSTTTQPATTSSTTSSTPATTSTSTGTTTNGSGGAGFGGNTGNSGSSGSSGNGQ
jgi:hypothetical protein